MEMNEVLNRLPSHLMELVIDQPYNEYTAQDQAVWRYIMRQNVHYLPGVAHESYLRGLRQTGIGIDSIPQMYGMNRILKEIGWAAVAVDGFIPPSAFMEFQAYNVLVIAADIRPITQIGYTPAPDIVHEAAGHAPIIADPAYSQYLVDFGKIGSKALSSAKDFELYEAIRLLSILKADPCTPDQMIMKAERNLAEVQQSMEERSEMAMIRNLHWWTVEYGLIGNLKSHRIYGAGLLSSISESYNCLKDHVKKIPYSVDAAHMDFDITRQQPQLFVTPDFQHLSHVLEQFTETMALRTGGISGLEKAISSGQVATCVFSSGLQASGVLGSLESFFGEPSFIRFTSPVSLAVDHKEIPGQGKGYHSHGFSSPVGLIRDASAPLERWSDEELDRFKNAEGVTTLPFVSGITVSGRIRNVVRCKAHIILITFDECTVSHNCSILYRPEWGPYDMAVGESIVSVYAGAADSAAYGIKYPALKEKTHKIIHGPEQLALHKHYHTIRELREAGQSNGALEKAWMETRTRYPDEWLLSLEILEMIRRSEKPELYMEVLEHLKKLKKNPEFAKLVEDGLSLLERD